MGIGLRNDLVSNMVNNIFRLNGKNPASTTDANAIEASPAIARAFGGDHFLSSKQVKDAIENPAIHVALSFDEPQHAERADELAALVVDAMPGSKSGAIRLDDRGGWADFLKGLGFNTNAGMISTAELKRALASGAMVIGEGGQLMTKREAKDHGDLIVAIHQNNKGPKFVMEQ